MCSVERQVDAASAKRKATGLESVVDSLKKKKLSSIAKSHLDWQQFKSERGLGDELEREAKAGYLDEQAFLQRADWRQFQREKEVRDVERRRRAANETK